VIFVGYVVSPGEIRMEDSKILIIRDWLTLITVKEIKSFLGLVNFYRMFIKGFGGIVAPLTHLTKKDVLFDWITKEQEAFNDIKKRIIDEPMMRMADLEREFEVEIDASDYAMGG
jgi:hypothetical protein